MSSGYVECGNCGHGFDCTIWENGKARYQNPMKCPKCNAIAKEFDHNKHEWVWSNEPR